MAKTPRSSGDRLPHLLLLSSLLISSTLYLYLTGCLCLHVPPKQLSSFTYAVELDLAVCAFNNASSRQGHQPSIRSIRQGNYIPFSPYDSN